MKKYIKTLANRLGFHISGNKRLGVDFWHDFKLLSVDPTIVFDVGANVGQWAGECRMALPQAVIHSFEPEPTAYQALSRQFLDDPRHSAHQLALSNLAGNALLRVSEETLTHSLETSFKNQSLYPIGVETQTVDTMLDILAINHLPLLKIDIEGHEIACLNGATEAFEAGRIDAICIEAGFAGGIHTRLSHIEDFLHPYCFHFLSLYDIVPFRGRPQAYYCNALFVHEGIALS